MKKILIAVVVALVTMASANAQVAPGMKYKDLKGMYDTKEYVQQAIDPYRVGWTKFFSFFTPGLGHIMMGEVGRGFIFVGAEAVCTSIIRDSWDGLKPYLVYDENGTVTGFSDRDAAGKHITGERRPGAVLLLHSFSRHSGRLITNPHRRDVAAR